MLGDFLSSRWIQGSLVFFFLSVSGSFLYSWHVKRTTAKEFGHHDRFLQGLPIQNETGTAADTIETSQVNFEPGGTPLENQDAQAMANDTDVSPIDDATAFDDLADAFLSDDFVLEEETEIEDVPVSPYGFGPYPEVPTDCPLSVSWEWDAEHLANMKKAMEKGLQERSVSRVEQDTLEKLREFARQEFTGGSFY